MDDFAEAKLLGRLTMSMGALVVSIGLVMFAGPELLEHQKYTGVFAIIIALMCYWLGGFVGRKTYQRGPGLSILYAQGATLAVLVALSLTTIALNFFYIPSDTLRYPLSYIALPVGFFLIWGAVPCIPASALWGWALQILMKKKIRRDKAQSAISLEVES